MLRDETSVHTAAIVAGAQEVVDIQADCDWTERIFTIDVQDAAGWYLMVAGGLLYCLLDFENPLSVPLITTLSSSSSPLYEDPAWHASMTTYTNPFGPTLLRIVLEKLWKNQQDFFV